MKRLLSSILALSLFFAPVPTFAEANWTAIAKQIQRSVVYLESADGACTAFVINSSAKGKDDEDVDYVLTAAHCEGKDMYVDQTPVTIKSKDTKKDLMVLEVPDLDRPAIGLAKENPKQGEEVMSFGYGYALDRPLARVTHISDDNTYIPTGGIGGPLMVTDVGFVSGQSGGPVVDTAGNVVMIVQMGNPYVGIGVGAETIKSKVGKYFERKVAK